MWAGIEWAYIKDSEDDITIHAKDEAKYFGQYIGIEGTPLQLIKQNMIGLLLCTMEEWLFQCYIRSRIDHLFPMIPINGGIYKMNGKWYFSYIIYIKIIKY